MLIPHSLQVSHLANTKSRMAFLFYTDLSNETKPIPAKPILTLHRCGVGPEEIEQHSAGSYHFLVLDGDYRKFVLVPDSILKRENNQTFVKYNHFNRNGFNHFELRADF